MQSAPARNGSYGAWIVAARTHAGCVRQHNEDRYLIREDLCLFAVADGMGGHEGGDVASAVVMDALAMVSPAQSCAASVAALELQLQHANRQLQAGGERTKRGMMGSTVVALLIAGDEFVCLWAGDSRCYLRREGKLGQITADHSLVQELIDKGRLTALEAKTHPRANVITRAVGALPDLILERRRGIVRADDLFVLCSDGLWGVLDESEINAVLATTPVVSAAEALIELALARGARDNVTAVVAGRLGPSDPLAA